MMDEFLSARRTIEIVVFLIGSKRVANALVKARKRGIAIRMIIDAMVARSRYSKDDFLKGRGIEVKTVRVRGGSMHSKFILIDGEKLIASSSHLTNDANLQAWIDLLDLSISEIAHRLVQEMDKAGIDISTPLMTDISFAKDLESAQRASRTRQPKPLSRWKVSTENMGGPGCLHSLRLIPTGRMWSIL